MIQQIAPYFGYLASLFLVIALLVVTDAKFRLFNILGNISFITYGIVFQAWPVIITNVILLFINIYYLNKLYSHKEDFDLVAFTGEEKLAQKFLQFYKDDISSYFPGFIPAMLKSHLNFVVLRDLVIANMFSAELSANGDATVNLNYTIKKYRDFKVGDFLFGKGRQWLISNGVKRIIYNSVHNKGHEQFLLRNGFTKDGGIYFRSII